MSEDRPKLPIVARAKGYAVGYGKPPESTRFKPGQFGNPKGRPRGAKNKTPRLNEERLKEIVLKEAYREITVRDGSRNVSVPMAQAVVRALAVNAAKGQNRAQRLFAEMLSTTERQNKALANEWLETAITYKVEWERELAERDRLGVTHLPPPLPHPDQVIIDMNTGEARIQGPMTKEDVERLEHWTSKRNSWVEEVAMLTEELKTVTDDKVRALMQADFDQARKLVEIIDRALMQIGY